MTSIIKYDMNINRKIMQDKNLYKLIIRTTGRILLLIFVIDIIFFQHKHIQHTIFENGLFMIIAVLMSGYGIDYKEMSIKKRLLHIVIILIFACVLLYFWYN